MPPSPSSFLTDARANSDLGLTLQGQSQHLFKITIQSIYQNQTYLPTCLLRRALSLAVQGLMMLSDGEMYCFVLQLKHRR
jgi:hypothetical protein